MPDERMQELNRVYRGIDSNTDVLSFHYFEPETELQEDEVFGEILFSYSKIVEQATTFGHTPTEEVYRLTVHGLLHLQGYDHETEEEYEIMWEHEQYILG
jgi:probable rRNA maturation factor